MSSSRPGSRVLPADADRWPDIAADCRRATRREPGCLWFIWSRSVEEPTEYVLLEAFRDDDAALCGPNPS